jgi:hypothetical protein
MLLVSALVGALVFSALRLFARRPAADLGWMSEQWVASHRGEVRD